MADELSPSQQCTKQGLKPGTPEYEQCVMEMSKKKMAEHGADSRHDICKARGLTVGTPDFRRCMDEVKQKMADHDLDDDDDDKNGDGRQPYPYPTPYPYPSPHGPRRITERGQVAPAPIRREGEFPHPIPAKLTEGFTVDDAIKICHFKDECPILPNVSYEEAKKDCVSCKFAQEYGCPVFFKEVKPMKFGELPEVEVFATGTHRGKEFNRDDMEKIAANFKEFGTLVQPPFVLGHDEKQEIIQNSGLPALGWVKRVWVKPKADGGHAIVVHMTDVPDIVKKVIEQKRYKRISAELYPNFQENGNSHGLMLRRVSLLGADIPEVKNLADVVNLYENAGEMLMVFSEGGDMPATKEKGKGSQADDARFSTLEREFEAEKKKNRELASEMAKESRLREKAEIDTFCEKLKKDGKYLPAWDEMGMREFLSTLDDSRVVKFSEKTKKSARGFVLEFLEAMPKVVDFSELSKQDLDAIKVQKGTAEEKNSALDVEAKKLVRAAAERKEVLSYIEAVKQVGRERPELVE